MRLLCSYLNVDCGFLALEDADGCCHAFCVYGKNEVRRVLAKCANNGPNAAAVLSDLNRTSMLDEAAKPTVELEGPCVRTLVKMATYGAGLTYEKRIQLTTSAHAVVCCLFTPTNPNAPDALIGYVDRHREHCITIFFSKEQGRKAVDDMSMWLPKEAARNCKQIIIHSGLPKRTKQPPIVIEGNMAKYLNCSYMEQMAAER